MRVNGSENLCYIPLEGTTEDFSSWYDSMYAYYGFTTLLEAIIDLCRWDGGQIYRNIRGKPFLVWENFWK